jgi:hypothetical protein
MAVRDMDHYRIFLLLNKLTRIVKALRAFLSSFVLLRQC